MYFLFNPFMQNCSDEFTKWANLQKQSKDLQVYKSKIRPEQSEYCKTALTKFKHQISPDFSGCSARSATKKWGSYLTWEKSPVLTESSKTFGGNSFFKNRMLLFSKPCQASRLNSQSCTLHTETQNVIPAQVRFNRKPLYLKSKNILKTNLKHI